MENNIITNFAQVILKRDNEICFLQRLSTKTYAPNAYHLIGGHIEVAETPTQAIVREVFEEIGVVIKPEHLIFKHVSYIISIDCLRSVHMRLKTSLFGLHTHIVSHRRKTL